MKIAIIQTAFIGDVILATPIIEAIKDSYPKAEIHFVCRQGNESLLQGHPYLTKVWVFHKKKQKYKHLYQLIAQLRREKFDIIINAQRFFTTGLMTVLAGAKKTIGFDKNPLSFLYTTRVKHEYSTPQKSMHEVDRNLSLVSPWCRLLRFLPKLYPSQSDFETTAIHGRYITISPASVWFTKQYPKERWITFLDRCNPQISVYILGGPGDKALAQAIQQATTHPLVTICTGQYTLLQSAAIMAKAEMNYTNDSAPMHLASAMNAPVTALYCSTLPEFGFGPLSTLSQVMEIHPQLDCRPCGLHGKSSCPLGHFACGQYNISPR